MQFPVMLGTELEHGKRWPVMHKYDACAKDFKTAKEVFALSGSPGEICEIIEVIECPEMDEHFPSDNRELWVLGAVLIMN